MGWMVLLDKENNEIGTVGDEGWDLSNDFVDSFLTLYYNKLGKIATKQEIMSSIEFVYNGCVEELKEEIENCDSQAE